MPRKPEDKAIIKSVRLSSALLDRVEEARINCRPVPNVQEFFAYLLEQGLKSVEAPK